MTERLPEPQRAVEIVVSERASATPARRTATPRSTVAQHRPLPRSLAETQAWMIDAITTAPLDDVHRVLTAGPRLDAAGRLAIYQSGYYGRLVECLLDDYPVIAASLGDERFTALCEAYVERHPSSAPSLNFFGRHFAAFCGTADGLSKQERAVYRDLAALEWALVEVIHARTAAPIDATALAGVPVEAFASARFERSPAVRLLHFEHPVNALYRAFRETGDVPELPSPAASATVVYRAGAVLWRMDLTPAMARVLGALLDGAPLGEALEAMGTNESDPDALAEAERSVMVWFREWIEGAMFTGLCFDSP